MVLFERVGSLWRLRFGEMTAEVLVPTPAGRERTTVECSLEEPVRGDVGVWDWKQRRKWPGMAEITGAE